MSAVSGDERLVVLLEARITDFEKNMRKAGGTAGREYDRMRRGSQGATRQMETDMVRASGRINQALAAASTRIGVAGRNFVGGFGAGLAAVVGVQSARQIAAYADEYKGLQNALRDAGRSGDELKTTFGGLFRIAQDQGAAIGSLVGLYRDAAAAGDVLNASERDRLKFAEGVANALRIEGKSATEAAGPLQQLGQLLSAGTVRAEEFNSVNEGARPILQAVANGLEEAGGSISKLRKLVLEGKVSSEAFFRAFLAGSDQLAERADRAQGRVGQSMNRIGNAMILLSGHIDEVSGASTNAASGLNSVASAIEALPGYIDAALAGMGALTKYLNDLGNSSVFKKINDALGYNDMSDEDLAKLGIKRVGTGDKPTDRVSSAFDTTAGTGVAEAEKAGRVIGEGAKDAKVSLKDFSTAVDDVSDGMSKAAGKGMLDLIGMAEGTDKGRGYNETLANGRFTGGDKNLVFMTLDDVDSLQSKMLKHPDNTFNSSAVGRYQIVQTTMRGLRKELGLSGSELFSPDIQDRMANQLLRRRGGDVGGLRNEWEGLRKVDPTIIKKAWNQETFSMPAMDPGYADQRKAATEKQKQQSDAYKDLIADSQAFTAEQKMEMDALGMTTEAAAKLRYEHQLLAEAQRAGIDVTAEQRARISELAATMAEAETATDAFHQSQADTDRAMAEWKSFSSDSIKGFVSDLRDGKSAGEAFAGVLEKITDKLLDMSIDGILDGLFSSGKDSKGGGGGGGLFGSLIGSLFGGFKAAGGPVDPSKGYVVGENGPEFFQPKSAGTIVPNRTLVSASSRMGASAAPASMTMAPAAPAAPIINVYNSQANEVQATTRQNRDGSIDVMIDKIVAQKLGQRGTASNKALSAGFDAPRKLRSF